MHIRRTILGIALCALFTACSQQAPLIIDGALNHANRLPEANLSLSIDGLSHCTSKKDVSLRLNRNEPIVVIVHGCFSSAGRFRALADVFAFHGQQTLCFNYDDRDRISQSAEELNQALASLTQQMGVTDITVIGHSQGGLVSRYAVSEFTRAKKLPEQQKITLATISGPFGGIEAASHCGWNWLHIGSFGLSTAICQAITGSKWTEIPPSSQFIQSPTPLTTNVSRYLKINTDETDSCRRYDEHGKCLEDDFVFALREQNNPKIDSLAVVDEVVVRAGHVEIVGDSITAPDKLITVLQQKGILNPTPEEQSLAFQQLKKRLYLDQEI